MTPTLELEPELQQLVTQIEDGNPDLIRGLLRERAKLSLAVFCKEVLGYADLNREHEALCEYLQCDPAPVSLILMPRYTFKSSICTVAESLWRLLNDPNERILIYADATDKAEGFLTSIKNHLLGLDSRSRFRDICGAWEVDPKRGVWNQSAIVIAPRTYAYAEPSVDTAGLETSKVGKHYGRIIFDDLVSDKNITTKDLLDKVAACYRKALSLLQPGGKVRVVGTRWDFGDLYGRLLAEYEGREGFSYFKRKAHEGTRYFFADIGPNALTPEFLTRQREAQGSALFSALYQNEPVDEETATFKARDFAFYTCQARPERLYVTCTLDPIPPPSSDHGDDAALTVVGTDEQGDWYVLDAIAGRLEPDKQLDAVFDLWDAWRFAVLGIETNAFQKMLLPDLERRLRERRSQDPNFRPFHVEEFTGLTLGSKETRIRGLQPLHERGALKLPGERLELLEGVWSKLAHQLLHFPKGAHDDLIDSLSRHLQLSRRAPVPLAGEPERPFTSAAWYEREIWYKQQLRERKRMPRWKRPPMPQLAFS